MASNSNLTVKASEALQKAFELAAARGNPETLPTHLLAAMLEQEGGLAPRLLAKIGVPSARLADEVATALERLPRAQGGAQPQPSRDLRQLLDAAAKLAPQFQDDYVSIEHVLMASG
jgi:ATP-dependent Clp protease ATP-binding subunit ClpB